MNCVWGQVVPEEELGPLAIDYYYLFYCFFSDHETSIEKVTHHLWKVSILVIFLLWIIWLIHLLSQTAANYFSPTLATISSSLQISHDLAGVTLLALGNGAPDIFSILASFKKSSEDPSVGVGEIIGASLFSSAIVIGSIAILCPCDISSTIFLRDYLFHFFAAGMIGLLALVDEISFVTSLIFFLVYFIYILVVLLSPYLRCLDAIRDKEIDEENTIHCQEHHHGHHHEHYHDREMEYVVIPEVRVSRPVTPLEEKQSYNHDHLHHENVTPQKSHEHFHSHAHTHAHLHDHDGYDRTSRNLSRSNSYLHDHPNLRKFPSNDNTYDYDLVLKLVSLEADELEDTEKHEDRLPTLQNPTSLSTGQQYGTFIESMSNASSSRRSSPRDPAVTKSCLGHSHPHTCNHPAHRVRKEKVVVDEEIPLTEPFSVEDEDEEQQVVRVKKQQEEEEEEDKEGDMSTLDCYTILYHYSATLLESLDWRKFALQRKFYHQLISQEWKNYSKAYQYYYLCFEFPITLFRDFSIPSVEPNSWNQFYAMMHPLCDSLAILYLTTKFEQPLFGDFSPILICFLFGIGGIIFIALTTTRAQAPTSPIFHWTWTFMAFIMCIVWIYIFAEELVTCLTTLGKVLHIPSAVLGITILAWGNGMGDYCTNLAIAKQGYGSMAIVGSNAGPIFNILIGFGLSLVYTTARQYPQPYRFQLNHSLLLSLFCLMGILGGSVLFVSIRRFQLDSLFGMILIASYLIFSLIQLWILVNER